MSAATRIHVEDVRKGEAFKRAIAWVADRFGPAATVEAFGDATAINEAWEHRDLEGFRAYLWERCQAVRKGAA